MAKVYGIFTIELKEGIEPRQFIDFINQKFAPMATRIGWKGFPAIGDRGERKGKLALIWDFDSIEQRDKMVPVQDQITDEALRLMGPDWEANSKIWDSLVASSSVTDYVVQE